LSSYGRGARILSVGIATTGLVTFAYFSLASHGLSEVDYKGVTLLWSVMFLIISIIYRPVEQLLSRTISARRARGLEGGHSLRPAVAIQAAFAVLFLLVALAFRERIEEEVFDGSAALYWVLVVGVLAYAVSYFARGWLAGHSRFGLYGGLVLLESCSRCLFAVAVVIGIASGQTAVALGIAAAPLVSLMVVPWAIGRRGRGEPAPDGGGSMREGAGFAGAVLAIMIAEQTLLNGPVLAVDATAEEGAPVADGGGPAVGLRASTGFAGAVLVIMAAEQALLNGPVVVADATASDAALAGFVFNVLLITRAPLQLFQAIQTSLLPHLSGLAETGGGEDFSRALRVTVLWIAAFAGAVSLGLLLVGPFAMDVLFGGDFEYDRGGLVLVGVGMGFHLTAGTLNQAALARGRAAHAAAAWLACAALFLGWLLLSGLDDPLLEVQIGYAATTAALVGALWLIERSAGV
jgi:O-antigen/teichoic acid export membrane protein